MTKLVPTSAWLVLILHE